MERRANKTFETIIELFKIQTNTSIRFLICRFLIFDHAHLALFQSHITINEINVF